MTDDTPNDALAATPDGIVRCIREAHKLASDVPHTATGDAANDFRREALTHMWVALNGLVALSRHDRAGAFGVLADVDDAGALRMFTMQAVIELAELGWTPPWPDADEGAPMTCG